MKIITPCKIHHLKPNLKSIHKRLAYHLRIQKKWIKRYGHTSLVIVNDCEPQWYIMHGQYIYPEPEFLVAAFWFNQAKNRRLNCTILGDYWVSTVFLGLDHNWGGYPILFETMAFKKGDMGGIDEQRASSYKEAMRQHKEMVQKIKQTYFH